MIKFKVLFFLMIFALTGNAQRSYQEAIQQGDSLLRQNMYLTAINKYFAAEAFDPSKKEEVTQKVNEVFRKIQDLKKEAEEARETAEFALRKVEREQRKTKAAERETQIALERAKKLVDAYYYYDGRIALAFKDQKFYFIDTNGDRIESLGSWAEAKQFDEETNLASVKNERSEDFLLDTEGDIYQVAYDPMAHSRKYLSFKKQSHIEVSGASKYIADSSGITMTGWFYFENLDKFQGLFGFRHTEGNIGYKNMGEGDGEIYAILIPDGKLECRFKVGETLNEYVTPPNTVAPKSWNHYALVYDSTELILYINGTKIGSDSVSTGTITGKNRTFAVGRLLGGPEFALNGKVDEVSLWSKALQPSEIKEMMENELTGKESNLELYYKFDEGVSFGDNTAIEKVISQVGKGDRNAELVGFELVGNNSNFGEVLAFDLANEELSVIPKEVLDQRRLKILVLSHNHLWQLPSQINQLENLICLDLRQNNLRELPAEIGELKHLDALILADNQLVKIPAEIGNLENLSSLNLSGNNLDTFPSQILALTNLTSLKLNNNNWQEIPEDISKLKKLTTLTLSSSQLKNLPDGLIELSRLKNLDLSKNALSALPDDFNQLNEINRLDLSDNLFAVLPKSIEGSKTLDYLDLRRNPISEEEQERIKKIFPPEECEVVFAEPADYEIVARKYHEVGDHEKAFHAMNKAIDNETDHDKPAYIKLWSTLSYYALFTSKPVRAIAAAEKTLELDSTEQVQGKLALGYLLSDEWLKAKEIYEKNKGKNISGWPWISTQWDDIFMSEIEQLENAGIKHSDFKKVKEMFKEEN